MENNLNLDNLIKEVKEDVGKYASLCAVKDSEGGKILISTLERSLVSTLERVLAGYAEMGEVEMKAYIAKVKTELDLLRVLTRSEANKDMATEELTRLLEK